MAYIKKFLAVGLVISLAGCSTLGKSNKSLEEGYRAGVKQEMAKFTGNFYGNDFPYFYWESPIVQNVRIPAHIENGLFVPEHNEPVVIEPGDWRKSMAYPLHSPGAKEEAKKTEGGRDYAFDYLNLNVRDITVLPQEFVRPGGAGQDKDTH